MELLDHPQIKSKLNQRTYFDLKANNQRLDIIIELETDPVAKLKEVFQQVLTDDKSDYGYYYLNTVFNQAQMVQPDIILRLVVETISQKIALCLDALSEEKGLMPNVSLGMYNQVWSMYKTFCNRLHDLIKNYQNNLVEKNIKSNKISHDILIIIQICLFHKDIISGPGDIISKISNSIESIDPNDVEKLIDFIDSIRSFMIMSDYTKINKKQLVDSIKRILSKASVINAACLQMHKLAKSLSGGKHVLNSQEYQTSNTTIAEKKIIKKIYKMATILSTYSEKEKFLICYTKFMQSRIIDCQYSNLELELEMVRRISSLFGRKDSQKLIDIITDIIDSRNISKRLHSAEIKVVSDKYSKVSEITPNILNPVVLTKSLWQIYNVSDMDPIYPLDLSCYLDIISKLYAQSTNNSHCIKWQPNLGMAQFQAYLGQKKVDITCNMLQTIALGYLNNNTEVTIEKFSDQTQINKELSSKIFESLFEANLVTQLELDGSEPIFVVNSLNYAGDPKIDIRKTFMEVFVEEPEAVAQKPSSIKTVNAAPKAKATASKAKPPKAKINPKSYDSDSSTDEDGGIFSSDDEPRKSKKTAKPAKMAKAQPKKKSYHPNSSDSDSSDSDSSDSDSSDSDSDSVPMKVAKPTKAKNYGPVSSDDESSSDEKDTKKAQKTVSSDSCSSSEDEAPKPAKSASSQWSKALCPSPYQQFIQKTIKEQEDADTSMSKTTSNKDYLREAAKMWREAKNKKQKAVSSDTSSSSSSEDEAPKPAKPASSVGRSHPHPRPPSAYQEFIRKTIPELRNADTTRSKSNSQYMAEAAKLWQQHRLSNQKN